MASRGNQQKASFFSAERSDKGQGLEREQSSLPPPPVALSLRTRESCALALKHIFDRVYSPAERRRNEGTGSVKDERRDYIEVEAYGRDIPNRAFQGCIDQKKAPSRKDSSSRENNEVCLSETGASTENMHKTSFHAHEKVVHDPNLESYIHGQDHQFLSRQATSHQAVMRTRPPSPPLSQQRTAQLTLFYAGTVNIYDDVPADKAKAIMLLAETRNPSLVSHCNQDERGSLSVKGNSPFSPSMYMDKSSAIMKDPNNSNGEAANTGTESRLNLIATSDVQRIIPTGISSNNLLFSMETRPQHAAKESQIGLPQARKASLARFMERKRHRFDGAY
ncbi:hypothetical protein KP509_18G064500 [Ceratopteris richardii]|uniref:Tify domain-containing protein n=1 Tax=Ceratopteris richardii TaxID=49495 RepID=A0A8T2SU12_CERRI|nr:hypothetical protein KP509_18G064500 [Ceratopteris richardii]